MWDSWCLSFYWVNLYNKTIGRWVYLNWDGCVEIFCSATGIWRMMRTNFVCLLTLNLARTDFSEITVIWPVRNANVILNENMNGRILFLCIWRFSLNIHYREGYVCPLTDLLPNSQESKLEIEMDNITLPEKQSNVSFRSLYQQKVNFIK